MRRRNGDRSPNASIPCDVFLVLLFCEEHHGLPFALIEAFLNVGVFSLLCRVLEDQVSLLQVTSGGGEPARSMPSVTWCGCNDVEAHEYYV